MGYRIRLYGCVLQLSHCIFSGADFADFGGPVVVCDDTQTMAFNKAVLHYMTHEPLVERYAAFGTFTSWAS
jgi:hypothetical protein